jgi:hypothetical protein
MSGQIFISYRREDSAAWSGRLSDRLKSRFPSNQIFMDVDTLDPGVDFVEAVEEVVGACDVLIAVIGSRWLTSSDRRGRRRLDIAEDLVRLEIATALKRSIRVVPVLVEGATIMENMVNNYWTPLRCWNKRRGWILLLLLPTAKLRRLRACQM